jgi:hypothetical protein
VLLAEGAAFAGVVGADVLCLGAGAVFGLALAISARSALTWVA